MKKLISLLIALAILSSLCITAFADENPYADTYYYKDYLKQGDWGGTGARYKTTTSKVYVVASSAPNSRTQVKTFCYVNGVITDKTVNSLVVLKSTSPETKYGITNMVYEDGDYTATLGTSMWLGVSPYIGSGALSGRWSPDWTGSGSVVIV